MAVNCVQPSVGFPDAETLYAIAGAANELADVIEKSVVTDAVVGSIREADANDLPVEPVLDKLEVLLYADPPSLAKVVEELSDRDVP